MVPFFISSNLGLKSLSDLRMATSASFLLATAFYSLPWALYVILPIRSVTCEQWTAGSWIFFFVCLVGGRRVRFIFISMWFHIHLCRYTTYVPSAYRDQERLSALELELCKTVNHHKGVRALHCWTISLVPGS